jgi:hypothetical protein
MSFNSDSNDKFDEEKYQHRLAQSFISFHAATEVISQRMSLAAEDYKLDYHCLTCGNPRVVCKGHMGFMPLKYKN